MQNVLRQCQNKDISIVVCQTAPMVSFVSDLAVFDLPMVFSKYEGSKIDEVLNGEDSEFHKKLAESYEASGFHALGFLQNATYRLTTSNVELKDLASFAGMQIRTMENTNLYGILDCNWRGTDSSGMAGSNVSHYSPAQLTHRRMRQIPALALT